MHQNGPGSPLNVFLWLSGISPFVSALDNDLLASGDSVPTLLTKSSETVFASFTFSSRPCLKRDKPQKYLELWNLRTYNVASPRGACLSDGA